MITLQISTSLGEKRLTKSLWGEKVKIKVIQAKGCRLQHYALENDLEAKVTTITAKRN
jgi:hypothetical protein